LSIPSTASNRTSFSSYPGVLSSLDDFYLMDPKGSGLVVLQTTNSVLDMALYDSITPESVLAWYVCTSFVILLTWYYFIILL
jgi:hypothetical protein